MWLLENIHDNIVALSTAVIAIATVLNLYILKKVSRSQIVISYHGMLFEFYSGLESICRAGLEKGMLKYPFPSNIEGPFNKMKFFFSTREVEKIRKLIDAAKRYYELSQKNHRPENYDTYEKPLVGKAHHEIFDEDWNKEQQGVRDDILSKWDDVKKVFKKRLQVY